MRIIEIYRTAKHDVRSPPRMPRVRLVLVADRRGPYFVTPGAAFVAHHWDWADWRLRYRYDRAGD